MDISQHFLLCCECESGEFWNNTVRGRWKLGASFRAWRENEWNFITKDHQHQKNGRLLAKSRTQFSAMLKVWCIQNLWLVTQPLTLRGNVKHWESWKYYFEEFVATCSSLSCSMTVFDHTQVQEQIQKYDALVSPSWLTHHIVITWHHQISFSFWNWRNLSGDNAVHWMMKSGERWSCGSFIKMHGFVMTDLWKYFNFGKSM